MNLNVKEIIILYLAVINFCGFASMFIDKRRAIRRAWRIPEKMLFLIAFAGGSLGSTIGLFTFRHKTKHWYFRFGMPLIFALQIITACYIIGSGRIEIM